MLCVCMCLKGISLDLAVWWLFLGGGSPCLCLSVSFFNDPYQASCQSLSCQHMADLISAVFSLAVASV